MAGYFQSNVAAVADFRQQFDVIVVGGGHAGTEAALASARTGAHTLLITHSIETLGQMSCNPAIGGIGKGHLVREIDALGGVMARAADVAGIQFRTLNASKGPAVQATRAQADRSLYRSAIRAFLENQPNLWIFQQAVADLLLAGDRVTGIVTEGGIHFDAACVVLTAGTFLAGNIHVGKKQQSGGRAGDPASLLLAEKLRELPFRRGRLKTGTPPRIDGRTVDFSVMDVQEGDVPPPVFSFMGKVSDHPRQLPCYITHTTEKTHDLIRASLPESALYSGAIEGTGPRYCPSIEDKVVRFADRMSHQVFVEPEGLNTHELYPNGISTSLPWSIQVEMVHSMPGFERAHLTRPGYAIEYDFFDPRDLRPSLETRFIQGLFFAGQINGTTGYEEAAAQGLIAGLNAARLARGRESWSPLRSEAYIGVLIDDLITRGTREPYRMFTSRAEYRLLLREDNADVRLTPTGYALGLVSEDRMQLFTSQQSALSAETLRLKKTFVQPGSSAAEHLGLSREYSLEALLRRPGVTYAALMEMTGETGIVDEAVIRQLEICIRYAGYIERQQTEIHRQAEQEQCRLPDSLDYQGLSGLSTEARQILTASRPPTLGMASRLPGITPAAISVLLVHLHKKRKKSTQKQQAVL